MQEAAELYESLAQQNSANAETWQKLGFAYQKNKLYDKAVKAYVQADATKGQPFMDAQASGTVSQTVG